MPARRLPPLLVAMVWNWVRWAWTLVSEMSGAARACAAGAGTAGRRGRRRRRDGRRHAAGEDGEREPSGQDSSLSWTLLVGVGGLIMPSRTCESATGTGRCGSAVHPPAQGAAPLRAGPCAARLRCGAAPPGTSRRCRAGAATAAPSGPSPRPGMPGRQQRPGVDEVDRHAAAAGRLGHRHVRLHHVRRAGDVGDHAAGADRAQRRGEQLPLQPGQRRQVRGLAAPAGLRPAAQRAQPGARRVDEHPVEVPLRQLRVRADGAAVGVQHGHRQAPGGLLDQPGPVLGDLDRGQLARRAARRARRAGRPCRPGRRTGPASGRPGRRAARAASASATSWEPSSCTWAGPSRDRRQRRRARRRSR